MGVALFQYNFLYKSRSTSLLIPDLEIGEIHILCFSREISWNQMGKFTQNQLLAYYMEDF